MCIDSEGNLIDLLDAKKDLDMHIIKTVGNPRYRLKEDSLRILRAIRFASILDFNIDDKTNVNMRQNLFDHASYSFKSSVSISRSLKWCFTPAIS